MIKKVLNLLTFAFNARLSCCALLSLLSSSFSAEDSESTSTMGIGSILRDLVDRYDTGGGLCFDAAGEGDALDLVTLPFAAELYTADSAIDFLAEDFAAEAETIVAFPADAVAPPLRPLPRPLPREGGASEGWL